MSGLLSRPVGEDDAERAQRYRIPNVIRRVPLNQISFHPGNRGTIGMVANDIMFNRTKLQDGYNKVGLITIPANKVTEVRAFTSTMSGDSDCMSWSNPRMTHAVVAETHFSMAKIMIRDSMSKYKRGYRSWTSNSGLSPLACGGG